MDFSRLGFGLDLVAWLRYCDAIDDGSTRSMSLAWMLCWILLALVLAWAWFLWLRHGDANDEGSTRSLTLQLFLIVYTRDLLLCFG